MNVARPGPPSLRFRLTLAYASLLVVPLVAFALVCYIVFSRALLSRTDRFIDDALSAFTRELFAERRVATTLERALETTLSEVRFPDLRIAIVDSSSGAVIASTAGRADDSVDRQPTSAVQAGIADAIGAAPASPSRTATVGAGHEAYRVLMRPVALRDRSLILTAAYPLSDIDAVLDRIRRLFVVAIPLFVLAAALGGYFMSGRSVARLEASFAQQQRFMADASHELRTPTAILRTEAEVTLSRPQRSAEEYRASFGVVLDAAKRLTRIVEDLFLLARADSGHLATRREALDLEELVQDTVRGVGRVADARAVRVTLESIVEAPIRGDPDLLGRLVLNLLDNAIKYSPEGATVRVSMARREGRFEIDVMDAGPGIPADMQGRVFERFFRADPARTSGDAGRNGGAGLGLAIGRRIAELHGGSLELAGSRPGLTLFRISLPAG